MKYLKNFLFAATLSVASLGLTSFSANAILITQTIEVTDTTSNITFDLGTVTVEVAEGTWNQGASVFSTDFGDPIQVVEIVLLGTAASTGAFDINFLIAAVDSDNIFGGIELLSFDMTELNFMINNTYQVDIDTFNAPGFADIFDSNGDILAFGPARLTNISVVSAPSAVALFGLVLVAMGMRRRAS